MISLFLNTASSYLHVAIVVDSIVKDEIYEQFGRDLSKMTLVKIKELLDRNGYKPDDVSDIYIVQGPGSFTGLRVGITIAKTYAWGLNKKMYALSNLFVMASSVQDYDYIVPIIDARRGYVYAGIYDKNYNNVLNDVYISLEDLKDKTGKLDGTVAFVSLDEFSDVKVINYKPDLNNTWKYLRCNEVDCYSFVPEYLKKTEAEETLEHDQGN